MASKKRRGLIKQNGHSFKNFSSKGNKKEKKYYPKKVKKEDDGINNSIKRFISY